MAGYGRGVPHITLSVSSVGLIRPGNGDKCHTRRPMSHQLWVGVVD